MKKAKTAVRIPKPPSYLRHARGQAFVRIRGKNIYLGKHGTRDSLERYRRVVGEYMASGGTEIPRASRRDEATTAS